MKRAFAKAYKELANMGIPLLERADHQARGNFGISAEDCASFDWVDYNSFNPEWVFGVHPKLDAVLRKHGLFAEWETPGSLNVYEA